MTRSIEHVLPLYFLKKNSILPKLLQQVHTTLKSTVYVHSEDPSESDLKPAASRRRILKTPLTLTLSLLRQQNARLPRHSARYLPTFSIIPATQCSFQPTYIHGFHVCRSDRDRGGGCTISSGCISLDKTVGSFFPFLLLQMENRKLYRFPFTVDNNAIIKRTRLFVTTFRPVETKMKIGCYVTVCSFFRWKNGGTV